MPARNLRAALQIHEMIYPIISWNQQVWLACNAERMVLILLDHQKIDVKIGPANTFGPTCATESSRIKRPCVLQITWKSWARIMAAAKVFNNPCNVLDAYFGGDTKKKFFLVSFLWGYKMCREKPQKGAKIHEFHWIWVSVGVVWALRGPNLFN